MPIQFRGQSLGIHPSALRWRTEEDIERVLRTNVRVETDHLHGRHDIVAVAGWDTRGLPMVVLVNTRLALVFHANKPCDEFRHMFS